MSSLRTQKLVNNFPIWTKARKDPSSLAFRMFSVWADYFEFAQAELVKMKENQDLLKLGLGRDHVWRITLQEEDQLIPNVSSGGLVTYTYPTSIQGTIGSQTYVLTEAEDFEELQFGAPTRLTLKDTVAVTNFLVWSKSNPTVYNPIDNPSRLLVVVSNSTNYFKRTPLRNPQASGSHSVKIEGWDINWIKWTEYVDVRDDGPYWTKNLWAKIDKVSIEGFNGDVNIYLTAHTDFIDDRFRLAVTDQTEGPLKLRITTGGTPTQTTLEYFTHIVKSGEQYRDGSPELTGNEDTQWEQHLLDKDGNHIECIDIEVSPDNAKLYAIDANGYLHVYEHGPSSFIAPAEQSTITKSSYIEVQPLKPWALLNETMRMWTWHIRLRFPIVKVQIKCIDPDGIVTYLQADKTTWGPVAHPFSLNNSTAKVASESWQDISFSQTFSKLGQWDFYTIVKTLEDTTISHTGVMCDGLRAVSSIDTKIVGPTSIFFNHDSRLGISNSTNIYLFDQHLDKYMFEEEAQEVFFSDGYDQVEVN